MGQQVRALLKNTLEAIAPDVSSENLTVKSNSFFEQLFPVVRR
jgi:hypothetical protein